MDLKLKDVAEILNVSQSTVSRWVTDGKIPSYKIKDEYRFSRIEIENWMLQSDSHLSPFYHRSETGVKQYSLFRAINRGQVYNNIPGTSKEEVIREAMNQVSEELDLDSEILTNLLLERENLMPTALNHGIAVPHTRDFLLDAHYDVVSIVYLENPIEYGALDGEPVSVLFFLFACDDRRHLNLLAKIAHLASNPTALSYLKSHPPKDKLLDYIKQWESEKVRALS